MSPRYTPKNIAKTIKSVNDVLELEKKKMKNYNDLLLSLEMIQMAMHEDIEKWIREQEEKMFKIVLAEKRKENPDYSSGMAKMLARARIMKESKIFQLYSHEIPRWDDYKFQITKFWEKHRARLIKSGEIEKKVIKK